LRGKNFDEGKAEVPVARLEFHERRKREKERKREKREDTAGTESGRRE